MLNIRSWLVRNPRWAFNRLAALELNKPAPTTSSSDSAICADTSACAQARRPAAGSDVERLVFQSRRQVGARRLQGRKQREQQAAGERNGERVKQQVEDPGWR